MSSQESYFGLGFPNSNGQDGDEKAKAAAATLAGSTSTVFNVDALMQSYMQQCLSYHEVKQRENQHEHQIRNQNELNKETEYNQQQAPAFIPANAPSSANIKHEINADGHNDNYNVTPSAQVISYEVKNEEKDDFQQKLKNAKMIAQRLASKPIPKTETIPSSVIIPVSMQSSSNHHQKQQDDYYPYAQKRNHFLSKVHSTKLHSFFLKNLDYILKKDEEVHSIQLQYLQRQQEISLNNKKRKRHQRNNNHNSNGNVMGGIGTQERNKYQKSLERSQHSFMVQNNKKKQQKSCALYISGIKQIMNVALAQPGEKGNDSVQRQEQVIHGLFQSYGSISKVNYYTDKRSGLRKGDAFILYNWEEICKQQDQMGEKEEKNGQSTLRNDKEKYDGTNQEQEKENKDEGGDDDEDRKVDSFLKVICSQLNGVELPCGSILSVQPADFDYKNKKNVSKKHNAQDESGVQTKQSIKEENRNNLDSHPSREKIDDKLDDEEDLDDFFSSL